GADTGVISLPINIKYTYVGLRTVDGRQVAEISLSGELRESPIASLIMGDNGPVATSMRAVGKVSGYAFVDVKSGIVSRSDIYVDSTPSTSAHAVDGSTRREFEAKLGVTLEIKLQRQ